MSAATSIPHRKRILGGPWGSLVGDALGVPVENLSAERIRCRWRGKWRMRFIFGRNMVSDDTEHTMMFPPY